MGLPRIPTRRETCSIDPCPSVLSVVHSFVVNGIGHVRDPLFPAHFGGYNSIPDIRFERETNMVIDLASGEEFSNLVRQMNSMAESVMGRHYFGFSPTDAWRPNVNLYETDYSFLV